MKRNLLIGLLLAAGTLCLHAQPAIKTPVAQELNLQNFWFNSLNSAALAFSPLTSFADLELSYDRAQGDYKHVLEPQSQSDIKAFTSGALQFKGFALYGDFSYTNSYSKGSLYNSNLYQPTFSMPYYIADLNLSEWKRQNYDMGFKASFPTMAADRLALGVGLRYSDKVGAKQIDPRTVSYVVTMQVSPSIAYKLSESATIGLTLDYTRNKERTDQSCENYMVNQQVAIMRGLGNNTLGIVGGNLGVGEFLYSGNRVGAALGFSANTGGADLFAELGGGYEKITVMERPTFPRMRGATNSIYANAAFKANFGEKRNHRVAITGDFSNVNGLEYTQELVTSPKREWLTIAITPMSSYMFVNALASYDFYGGMTGDSYVWKAGADVAFDMMDQNYFGALFNNMGVDARLKGAYNAQFGESSALLTEAYAGYHLPLSGQYLNSGSACELKPIVEEMYPAELAYLMSSNINFGLSLTYSFIVAGKQTMYIKADGQYFKPLSASTSRLNAVATVGLLF